jgi:membrane protein required for colicin V production
LTLFDHVVLGITGFSILLGVLRGFTREVIALASWVLAFVAAGAWGADMARVLESQIADAHWRALASVVLVFLIVLVLMNIVAMFASRLIKSAGLGIEDRLFGAFFGVARGLVVVVGLVLLAGLTPLPRQPLWKDAMLAAPLEKAALGMSAWLPQEWAKYIKF